MKTIWIEKNECTGCAACENICPVGAITMGSDSSGFCYPRINEKCIDCGNCERICKKRLHLSNQNNRRPDTYAAWSKDEKLRYTSTSGGAFTTLANYIIQQGGVVYGARYNDVMLVEHAKAEDVLHLEKLKQSKYIQSKIGYVYKDMQKELSKGRIVAFVGTPCQVAGALAYLGKEYDNFYTIDFICRGVNSPKAFRYWLDEIELKENKRAIGVWFKYKINGWKKSPRCTRIDFDDGTHKVYDQENNLYMKGYLSSNLYIRPSCGNCSFKGVPRNSDITLADFWKVDKQMDDDQGTSMLLLNSEKGKLWFENIKDKLIFHKREFEEIFEGNACFTDSVDVPKEAERFLRDLDKRKFSSNIKIYEILLFIQSIPFRLKRKIMKIYRKR